MPRFVQEPAIVSRVGVASFIKALRQAFGLSRLGRVRIDYHFPLPRISLNRFIDCRAQPRWIQRAFQLPAPYKRNQARFLRNDDRYSIRVFRYSERRAMARPEFLRRNRTE